MSTRLFFILYLSVGLVMASYGQDIVEVKEINNAPNGNAFPGNFVIAGNKLFFIAIDEINYSKLWVTEGTEATTQLLGPMSGVIGTISGLVSYNGKVYFCYNDNITGLELWVSDGTVAGTKLFKDLHPGNVSSFPRAFTVANNKLFFMAETAPGITDLYVSDGTVAGTAIVKPRVDIFNGLTAFAIFNSEIYFISDDGTGTGYGLWKSNGMPGAAVLVKTGMIPGVTGCNYVVLNNRLYFSGFDYTHGSELWVTDGSEPGTYMVVNLGADGGGSLGSGSPTSPTGMVVYNGKIYFAGKDDAHGVELWVTDGSAAGTHMVKDIYPGTSGSEPHQITVFNGSLYMICAFTQELYKSDGTEAGTELVKGVNYDSRFGTVWNGKIYMVNGYDNVIWESDGTPAGTGPIKVQNTNDPVRGGGDPFTEYNGELYFSGSCYNITKGYELCKLTSASAVKAFSFTGNGNWSNPANWSGNNVPPATLPAGYSVVINGNCILDVTQHVQTGASITVTAGSTLLILGSLTIQ